MKSLLVYQHASRSEQQAYCWKQNLSNYFNFEWVLRWSRGSVLAFSTQVRGFKPGRSRRIFKGEKILSTPFFGRKVKPSVPSRRFAAWRGSPHFGKITGQRSRPQFPLPPLGSLTSWLTWRHLVVKSGNI